jgi:LacI family repressor for deo operon, udp, cdd, tsx, nupC, and nupG
MKSKGITLKVMAELLGFSIGTVSRSLADHPTLPLSTRLKVQELAKELGYKRSQVALSFRYGRSFTIGLIVPDLNETFFSSALAAIQETAFKSDYTVFVAQSYNDETREIELVEKMKNMQVDGLLVSVAKNTENFEHFMEIMNYGIPIVFFDRIPPLFKIHSVSCNIESATFSAVKFLINRGHRKIGIINGPGNLLSCQELKNGYMRALAESDIPFNHSIYVECDLSEESVEKAIVSLISSSGGLSSVVAFNDHVAIHAIKQTRTMHLNPNTPISFVSFSNLPALRLIDHGPIASIEQFPSLQGQAATQMLMELIDTGDISPGEEAGFRNVVFDTELILNAGLK